MPMRKLVKGERVRVTINAGLVADPGGRGNIEAVCDKGTEGVYEGEMEHRVAWHVVKVWIAETRSLEQGLAAMGLREMYAPLHWSMFEPLDQPGTVGVADA